MHDPLTLAFEIKNPFVKRHGYRPSLVDIWHKDPERRGSDDSCDWAGRHRPLDQYEDALLEAIWACENVFGNPPFYKAPEGSHYAQAHDAYERISRARYEWQRRHGRRWHPRWHIHHWRIRVWPLIHLRRWLFDRCSICGGRFGWAEAAVSSWGGDRVEHLRHNPPMTERAA